MRHKGGSKLPYQGAFGAGCKNYGREKKSPQRSFPALPSSLFFNGEKSAVLGYLAFPSLPGERFSPKLA